MALSTVCAADIISSPRTSSMPVVASTAEALLLFSLTRVVMMVKALTPEALNHLRVLVELDNFEFLIICAITEINQLVFLLFGTKCDHDSG